MKKLPIVFLLTVAVFCSCDKEQDNVKSDTGRRIVPVVSDPARFKSSDQSETVETHVIKAGDYDLIETVYDWNNAAGMLDTKAIITTDNINSFVIDAWADEISEGDNHFINKAGVSKSGSWTIAGNPTWINNTDIQFWSWVNADPSITSKNQTTLAGLTASVTGRTSDNDIIFAYNKEHRKLKEDGEAGTLTADADLHVHFHHALCQVGFTVDPNLVTGYKVTKIELLNVNTASSYNVVSNGASTSGGGTLTFNHTPNTPGNLTIYEGAGLSKGESTDLFLMIPQNTQDLQIRWTITAPNGITQVKRTATRASSNWVQNWEAGKNYVYTLGFKEEEIVYQSTETSSDGNFNRANTGSSASNNWSTNSRNAGWSGTPGRPGSKSYRAGWSNQRNVLVNAVLNADISNITRIVISTLCDATVVEEFRTIVSVNGAEKYNGYAGQGDTEIVCSLESITKNTGDSSLLRIEQKKKTNTSFSGAWYDYVSVKVYRISSLDSTK